MAARTIEQTEQRQPPIPREPLVRRVRRGIRTTFADWPHLIETQNFPMVDPGYQDLLDAERTGVPLPPDHPARRLPIL